MRELRADPVHPCFSCSPRSWTPRPCSLWTVFLRLSSLTPTGVATCTGETWKGSCSLSDSGSAQSRCRLPCPLSPFRDGLPAAVHRRTLASCGEPACPRANCLHISGAKPCTFSSGFACVSSVGQTAGQQGGGPEHLPVPQPSVQPPGGRGRRASRGGALRYELRRSAQGGRAGGFVLPRPDP